MQATCFNVLDKGICCTGFEGGYDQLKCIYITGFLRALQYS